MNRSFRTTAVAFTGHDEVSGQRATADYFMRSNRYCA